LVPVPDVDRGPADARNVLGVIMDVKHGKYQLGTANGILFGYYSYNQLFKASGSATLCVENVPNERSKSLREIVRLQSITGGQGMLKCDCKGGCKTNRCKCKQAKVLCNSRCHHSGTCDNK
jgi:hypothetical protein